MPKKAVTRDMKREVGINLTGICGVGLVGLVADYCCVGNGRSLKTEV